MRTNVFQVLKAVLAAVLISLVFVLLFTVIIQLFSLPTGVIKPVNQVFKILAVVGGGLLFLRGDHGLVKGAVFGAVTVLFTYLIFGLISQSLAFSPMLVSEVLLGAVSGGITGVIAVNLKTRV